MVFAENDENENEKIENSGIKCESEKICKQAGQALCPGILTLRGRRSIWKSESISLEMHIESLPGTGTQLRREQNIDP